MTDDDKDDDIAATLKRDIQATDDAAVMASLRAQLWKALASERGDEALCALQATRADWESWKLKMKLMVLHHADTSNTNNNKQPSKRRLRLGKKPQSTGETETQSSSSAVVLPVLTPTGTGPGLLHQHLNPTEPFSLNDYYGTNDGDRPLSSSQVSSAVSENKNPQQRTSPRQALRWPSRRSRRIVTETSETTTTSAPTQSSAAASDNDYILTNPHMTTALHEAARLGHLPLVQALLQHMSVDINARNGAGRTPLIMVAGGLTEREDCHENRTGVDNDPEGSSNINGGNVVSANTTTSAAASDLAGIRKPLPVPLPAPPEDSGATVDSTQTKAARAVRKFFHFSKLGNKPQQQPLPHQRQTRAALHRSSNADLQNLDKTRMATAMAIINYSHPEDGTDQSGQGPSMNSVDTILGRTALHYAAELGRTQLCQAIANSFGTMLTVVDDLSQTPMELAGRRGHKELAAYLEARALLYIDPYGMDEELLAGVEQRQQRELERQSAAGNDDDDDDDDDDEKINNRLFLAPPFCWYETWTMAQVQTERMARLERCVEAIHRISRTKCQIEEARKSMLVAAEVQDEMPWVSDAAVMEHENDGMTAVPTLDDHAGANAAIQDKNDGDSGTAVEAEVDLLFAMSEEGADIDDVKTAQSNGDSDEHAASRLNPSGLESETQSMSDADDVLSETEVGGDDGDVVEFSAAVRHNADDMVSKEEESVPTRTDFDVFERVHRTHAELLLKFNNWDEKLVVNKFTESPFAAFLEAGVEIPSASTSVTDSDGVLETLCLICCEEFDSEGKDLRRLTGCHHLFCTECLGEYLSQCSKTKTGMTILCPHHECLTLLSPVEVADLAPSLDVYESLLDAANENFVVAASDIRYCPHAGCEGVVKYNVPSFVKASGLDACLLDHVGAVCTATSSLSDDSRTYEGVLDASYYNAKSEKPPCKAHRFCFGCDEVAVHWPCPCDRMEEWKTVVQERVTEANEEEDGGDLGDHNDIAQKLWLKTNTRPCPRCKAPIQKNEGCNHMTCSNPQCKFEFCWICRNDWKLHNSETGGFFRCNRWVGEKDHDAYDEAPTDSDAALSALQDAITDPTAMANTYGTAMHASRVLHKKSREVARFIHHYERWNAHAESSALEQHMSGNVCVRLAPVVLEAIRFSGKPFFNFGGKGLSFLHSAFIELFECRTLLQHSYAFSFFRYKGGQKYHKQTRRRLNEKLAFEQLQSELELLTEQMSDVVARAHLRATQFQIQFLTASAAERRSEFTKLMVGILNKERKEQTAKSKSDGKRRHRAIDSRPADSVTSIFETLANASGNEFRITLAPQYDFADGQDDDDELDQAIRASLREFGAVGVGGVNDFDDEIADWACAACTYVNSRGRACAMCGALR